MSSTTKRIGSTKKNLVLSPSPSLSFPLSDPSSDAREPVSCLQRGRKRKTAKTTCALRGSIERWPKRSAPASSPRRSTTARRPSTKELLVSVFIAVEDQGWVRRTVPLVCKYWHELYRSQDASPLHETLELNFRKEVERASAREWGQEEDDEDWALRHPGYASRVISWAADYPIHGSRVISWAERRAGSKLHFEGGFRGAFEDFSPWYLGRLVTLTGPSLVELRIGRWGFEELRRSLRSEVARKRPERRSDL